MCGLAGLLSRYAPVHESLIRGMTTVLRHRGPDDCGVYVDGRIGLGHRRLAILDLASGTQPMTSADGRVSITYNGEIYNYAALRADLVGLGYEFRTTSDTEVILQGYRAWDVSLLHRLRGMFAFAIWDAERGRLLLARDRVGIKPLVYAWDGRRLWFASEIKALLQDPTVPRELDWEGVRDYFTHLFVPAPRTIFRAIRKLPAGCYLSCALDGGDPEIRRYWTLRMAPARAGTEAEWVERLRGLLDETVRMHMVSDVPIGAFLSGGLDSSTVVACMARASTGPVRTFSIGFDDADFDELAYARLVAARYGTEHVEMIVKPDVMELLPRLAWQFDEPFADASALPTYCVSKIARDHVTVALSGDGGDEAFAGYHRYEDARTLARFDAAPLALLKPLLRTVAACLPVTMRGRGMLELLGLPPLVRYFRMMTFQQEPSLAALLSPDALAQMGPYPDFEPFRRLADAAGTRGHPSVLQFIDLHHYLPDDILTKVDRTSMLASLETRVPLLDHVLLEFAATIPDTLKFHGGAGKYILHRAMTEALPAEVLGRRKMGFGVPLATWFRGQLRELVTEMLTTQKLRQRGIVRPATVTQWLAEHRAGRDRSPQLWSLVCFELWCRTWLDR